MKSENQSIRRLGMRMLGGDGQQFSAIMARHWKRSLACSIVLTWFLVGCSADSSQFADNGGIGGTGISQGTITAFGSIFVNGVEWSLGGAAVELDGRAGSETELRLGMNVRIVGEVAPDGLSGTAARVEFDDSIEGPIADVPVVTAPDGLEKSFTILGQTITVSEQETLFADGASFAGLAMDQVVEISGFSAESGSIRATRVALRGVFPAVSNVTLHGAVLNLVKNPDGSGIFDIGSITIRYLNSTEFEDFARADLVVGSVVDVAGELRVSGTEIDADEVELDEGGLGQLNAEDVEVEGFVSDFVSISNFRVAGIPVDASEASIEPNGFVVANGLLVEVEGRLEAGLLIADELESEEEESGEIAIGAAVTSVDVSSREVTVLGVVVFADGDTEIQDESDGDENFQFEEIQVGDWLKIEGFEAGPSRVRAKQIARDSAGQDVKLRGPVTSLDRTLPALSVLGQSIPLSVTTSYFDSLDQSRTEEEFFRTPGDVNLGDDIVVKDENAITPNMLLEADSIEID